MEDPLYEDCGWERWAIDSCGNPRQEVPFLGAWCIVMAEAIEAWLKENPCRDSIR